VPVLRPDPYAVSSTRHDQPKFGCPTRSSRQDSAVGRRRTPNQSVRQGYCVLFPLVTALMRCGSPGGRCLGRGCGARPGPDRDLRPRQGTRPVQQGGRGVSRAARCPLAGRFRAAPPRTGRAGFPHRGSPIALLRGRLLVDRGVAAGADDQGSPSFGRNANCCLNSSTTSSTRSPTGATCSQPCRGYAVSPANSGSPAAATHARKTSTRSRYHPARGSDSGS
jgi:hypothetical protein